MLSVSVGMYLSSRVEDDSRSSDIADLDGGDETRTVYHVSRCVETSTRLQHVRDRGPDRRDEEEALQWIAYSFPKNPKGPTKRWAPNIGALGP